MKCHCCPTIIEDPFRVYDPESDSEVEVCLDCYKYESYNCAECGDPALYGDPRFEVDGNTVCCQECADKYRKGRVRP